MGPYQLFDGIGRNLWGDYSGLAIDPDGETFWLFNEYADAGNDWAAFVGAFRVEETGAVPDVDTYAVTLAAGEQIGLRTSTPFAEVDTLAWVTGVRLTDGVLQIIGSRDDDLSTVNLALDGRLIVHADFLLNRRGFEFFETAEVQQIIAYFCEGDDNFSVAGNIDIPTIAHGDAGDDHLNGGGGPSVLDGGADNDTLVGGPGANILIGGDGSDRLIGASNSDLLIAGTTSYDENDEALLLLLEEWSSPRTYEERVDNIRTGSGPILGGTGITLEKGVTVFDDDDFDLLTGASERDWFFFDEELDEVNDLMDDEEVN